MPSSSSQHPQRHVCDKPGCTKSYARPDHLLRHQLNHEAGASTVLRCDQCERTFVRPDLLTRHLERHALRGKNLGRWSNHTKTPKKTKTDSTGFDHDAQSEDMFKRPRRVQDVEGPMREGYYGRPQSTFEPLHIPAQHSSQSPLMSDPQGMHSRNALLWTSSSPPTRNVDVPMFHSNGEPASIEAWRATTAAAGSISPTMARDVIHKATFVADRADPLLLAPLIVIGAHFGESRCHEFAVRVGAKLWGSFVSIDDFRPARATLQMLQGMVLTQAFCKMMASRPQHETSHLFSSFVVTLARRNACFFDTSHHGRYDNFDIETRWQMWSKDEMKKRISFMCFVLDARGALLFRHIPAMSCPQIHLHLPSPQDEFEAPSAQEWIALREARGAQSETHFIMAIKAAMNGQLPAHGDVWTHYILLHGLLSIAYDLRWKQNALLGNANTDWRQRVVRALDLWKVSLDIACCRKAEDLSTQVIYRKSCSLAVWSKIALYCDWIEIQIYAGLPSVLGRFIDRATFTTARNNVRSWANCSEGRQATWHSARFLASVLLGDGSTSFLITECEAAKNAMRSAAKDLPMWKLKGVHAQMSAQKSKDAAATYELVHHPWVLYLCSLVLWAYGQALAPPQENGPERAGLPESTAMSTREKAQAYFAIMATDRPEDLAEVLSSIKYDTSAVLQLVYDEIAPSAHRWELLQEACGVLANLLRSSRGGRRCSAEINPALGLSTQTDAPLPLNLKLEGA
ncbi:FOG: Zn-finger [Ceraceosorus bombacis]|uniref:FOG: Zn-finger n=1 Tax=Ceraceosorus bombacis TaxID=401625 RepID=A0A0P1BQ53_9BASI|nr:FOG: Zn-finger [Ceraceosorus bombacis]